jgi:hypothetical protein
VVQLAMVRVTYQREIAEVGLASVDPLTHVMRLAVSRWPVTPRPDAPTDP